MPLTLSMYPPIWQSSPTETASATPSTNQIHDRIQEEQRDPVALYNHHGHQESHPGGSIDSTTSQRWDSGGSSSLSIWSARQEDSSSLQSSFGSFGSEHLKKRDNLRAKQDIVSSMNDLSITQLNEQSNSRVSSLQTAAHRSPFINTGVIGVSGSSSVTSTGASIPGLTTAFSGSQSQYSSSNYNSSQSTNAFSVPTISTGPPPGFLSPITTSNQRQSSLGSDELDTSIGSVGANSQKSRQSFPKNRSRGRNIVKSNDSVLNDSNILKTMKDPDSSLQSALSMASSKTPLMSGVERPILPQPNKSSHWDGDESDDDGGTKKSDWLVRMNRRLAEIPIGELDPQSVPLSAIMNAWAKTKSSQGATMVEMWLNRAQQEYEAGNSRIILTNKMYTMAGKQLLVDVVELSLGYTALIS